MHSSSPGLREEPQYVISTSLNIMAKERRPEGQQVVNVEFERHRATFGQSSFSVKGSQTWNNLEAISIKAQSELKIFTTQVKRLSVIIWDLNPLTFHVLVCVWRPQRSGLAGLWPTSGGCPCSDRRTAVCVLLQWWRRTPTQCPSCQGLQLAQTVRALFHYLSLYQWKE